jgi:hypothetical protein
MGAMSAALPAVAASMAAFAMRSAMAAIFVIAALHALRDRNAFAGIVQAYRLLPEALGQGFALLLPLIECGIAAALLLPGLRFFGSLAALAMLACFTFAIAINLLRDRRDIACGCGGGTGQTISWSLVVRNVLLMAGVTASLAAPAHPHLEIAAMIAVAGFSSFMTVLYLAADQLMVNARFLPRAHA